MEIDDIINEVRTIIRAHLGDGVQVVLFGSQATGRALPQSDIDIGIQSTDALPIAHETMGRIRDTVESIPTLRGIDVVDLNTVGEPFKTHALRNARHL